LLAAGVYVVETLPPRRIVMATGAQGGAYHELGIRYRQLLAEAGIELQLLLTSSCVKGRWPSATVRRCASAPTCLET
jgi:TRAP-type uncharacterized transport system substrate-binding protein